MFAQGKTTIYLVRWEGVEYRIMELIFVIFDHFLRKEKGNI